MKEIKIRFVHIDGNYYVQKKILFWWVYIKYTVIGYGGSTKLYYCSKSKKKLLATIVEDHFKTNIRSCKIYVYPKIKIY